MDVAREMRKLWSQIPTHNDNVDDLHLNGRTILKWNLYQYDVTMSVEFICNVAQ
jgi:hypothetical protein